MSYKEKILTHFGPREVDLTTLIEGIIAIYGKRKTVPVTGLESIDEEQVAECGGDSIFSAASKKSISEATLDTILVELLTEDTKIN